MKPLYKYSAETARHNGELDAWRESKKENIRCRDFLDEQIAKRFDGMTLPSDCVENTVKGFGYDRTMWVIANTIQNRKDDGRFHSRNTEWAKRFNIPDTGRNYEFALNSHSCPVDGAADDIRKMYAELNLFSVEHIVRSDEPQDYTNKLLILRDTSLKEEYRTPENQLFFCDRRLRLFPYGKWSQGVRTFSVGRRKSGILPSGFYRHCRRRAYSRLGEGEAQGNVRG